MKKRINIASGVEFEAAVGYSRAVRIGDQVFVGGTTAVLPGGGAVGGDDIIEQTKEVMRRIDAALREAGATLEDVVRTRIFVTDMSHWAQVGAVHGAVFADIRPAATMVEVSGLITPDLLVEIEADAVVT